MSSDGNGHAGGGHLLFVWTPGGYRLEERDGDPPARNSSVDLGDQGRFTVQKLGASPYPDDPRPCAFLIREP
jgi:hypothetical protein